MLNITSRVFRASVLAAGAVVAMSLSPVAGRATSRLPATPFAASSVWNAPLSSSAGRDPKSSVYVSDLMSQIARGGLWMNTYAYSTPVFTVPAGALTVRVKLAPSSNPTGPSLQQTWLSVPMPPRARPASGSDGHLVIWQPSSDRMWEFWKLTKKADGWYAQWGGTMDDVSANPGYYTDPSDWGATATSLPLLGGLIRPSELAAGHIDHALAIAIPAARARYFAWPAQRTDGYVNSAGAIPEGQRFRLDPKLNLNAIQMSPLVRMIAVAAQRYGIIVRDQAEAVTFYAEDTNAEGAPNPYYGPHGWFEGQYVSNLLKAFPWSHLEALRDTLSCCWHH